MRIFFSREKLIEVYNYLLNFLTKTEFTPRKQSLYAFTRFRKGEFLLYVDTEENVHRFMQLPDRYIVNLTAKEFHQGVVEKLLDFVEIIPDDVFEVCKVNIQETTKI